MGTRLDYERRHQKLAPLPVFYRRIGWNILIALAMILGSLAVGMTGYVMLEGMAPLDAFLNAAMILSGMGPVATMQTDGGKVFAGLYALYSGIVIIAVAGVILSPIGHRMLHTFHAVDDDSKNA